LNVPAAVPVSSHSDYLRVRGLRYHVRRWGASARRADGSELPKIFLLHGFLDVSASFQYLVEPLLDRWQVLAPDLRGFGFTEWPAQGYWFQDYVADLEAIVEHYSPDEPFLLVGHSMGSQVANIYAGLRPQRVRRLVCLDGIGLADVPPAEAPARFRTWLDHLREPARQKSYASFAELAARVQRAQPRLTPERALFVARCWGRQDGRGRITLCADPKHRLPFPGLYRQAEIAAIWREVTAPTLFVDAVDRHDKPPVPADEKQRRRQNFREHRVVPIKAGHMLHFEAPEETARVIGDFLGEH
jgi:pimeloyl-ACP methyl ester carboxylesterase